MLVDLKKILKQAEAGGFAVPAFNVYNMETVMGVVSAAEKLRAPVIMQFYSRLATSGVADYLAPVILRAAEKTDVPVCMHLDHGEGKYAAVIALRNGATGIMVDNSTLSFCENVSATAEVVKIAETLGIGVEGELGHIGKTANGDENDVNEFTQPEEAEQYVKQTGVSALAIMVGTAHGRYKKAPQIDIERIRKIKDITKIPLVLHGGSGVPEDQIKKAIKAGIRKINFGTDLCFSFLDAVFETDKGICAIDLFMKKPIESVQKFAASKIKLLGADGKA